MPFLHRICTWNLLSDAGKAGAKGEGKAFKSVNEAILAYENEAITLHSRIKVRVSKVMPDGEEVSGTIESTLEDSFLMRSFHRILDL